ncbi:hypothetical protein B0A52_09342 [Exophiala mesophila]|uniref:Phenazine biosynthesis protein n=1 Tax=Exophiala mesophila TaxID=212818 RepID=A0A438MUA9_EXOME|nr:hypothetical protein B0A52_09342 [Exophiala mesophila]
MAAGPVTFVTLSVFSAEKFQGNPLAIVSVRGNGLPQARKSLIAKEFGYSETVFLHDAPGPGQPRLCEIFTETGEELPFAGHPIIGVAHYIFSFLEKASVRPDDRDSQRQTAILQTKAGKIPIFYNPYRSVAACAVPFQFHTHSYRVPFNDIIATQPHLQIAPSVERESGTSFPVVSIVKGMTFTLVDLTNRPELFADLNAAPAPEVELDQPWSPSFVGCLYYKILGRAEKEGEPTIHNIQARMISQGREDPGTGSACCALSCYLALQHQESASPENDGKKDGEATSDATSSARHATTVEGIADGASKMSLEHKTERVVFGIQQGIELGRVCTIAVEVDVKTDAAGVRHVANIVLSGRGVMFARGELFGP